jgi:tRNA threonylcarbamoyladenosine biosynthesis protein TsaB
MSNQPLTLSVETATLAGSVAITRGRELLGVSSGDPTRSHSNTLILEIKELLDHTGLSLHEVELFAVASGPGSFTGLRIGIATTKALAETLAKPCIGVPTLEAIALAAGTSDATVTLLPAGRGEVFVQMFSVNSAGLVQPLDAPAHLSPAKALQKYSAPTSILWAGPGAQLHSALIKEAAFAAHHDFPEEGLGSTGWRIAAPTSNLAQHVALLAVQRSEQTLSRTANDLKAIYVRPSDAEMKA